MKKKSNLTESIEDYLEAIYNLEKINKVSRVKDIALKLGVQRGSVTGALKQLNEKGLINYKPYGFITLTSRGKKIAKEITRRHNILKDFLYRVVQLEPDQAEATACRMEHAVDETSIDKLVLFIDFVDNCPRTGDDWIGSFKKYCATGNHEWEKCNDCIIECKKRHDKKEV